MKQKEVKIEDLIPEEAVIVLSGKKHVLRKINLEDEVWVKSNLGSTVDKIFVDMDFEAITRIAFRLLKDKSDFLGEEEDQIDDKGFPTKVVVTGPQKLRRCISGASEKIDLFWAVYKTFGISRPEPSEDVEPKKA